MRCCPFTRSHWRKLCASVCDARERMLLRSGGSDCNPSRARDQPKSWDGTKHSPLGSLYVYTSSSVDEVQALASGLK